MKKSVSFLLVLIFVFSAFAPAALAEEDRDAVFAEAMARLFPAEGSHAPAAALGNHSASLVVDLMRSANEGMNTYRARESEFLAALAQFD